MKGLLYCLMSYFREIGTLLSDYGSNLSEEQKKIFEVVLKGYVGRSSFARVCRMCFSQGMRVLERVICSEHLLRRSKSRWGRKKCS